MRDEAKGRDRPRAAGSMACHWQAAPEDDASSQKQRLLKVKNGNTED
jgi:hypothetical protein